MKGLDFIEGSGWLFFPELKLLVGTGVGVLNAVRDAPDRIDYWIGADRDTWPLDLALALKKNWDRKRVPAHLPSPTFVNFESGDWSTAILTEGCRGLVDFDHFPNEICNGEYRLQFTEDSMTIERRHKRLKPEYRRKMEGMGLDYSRGSGVGSRPKKKPGSKRPPRPPHEHAYAVWVSKQKDAYITRRKAELMTNPDSRPADFQMVRDKLLRSREQEIKRGKNGPDGKPYRHRTEEELLERTCNRIARTEATMITFEYRYEPVFVYAPADGEMEFV